MCVLCACLGFFQLRFFPFSSRHKLDNFFSWIIFLWHYSTHSRKIMWGHGLCWTALKENMQIQATCSLWIIPQIQSSLSPPTWRVLVGITAGCWEDSNSQESAERNDESMRTLNTRACSTYSLKWNSISETKVQLACRIFTQVSIWVWLVPFPFPSPL